MKRVVITGIGSISAIGHNAHECFDKLLETACGIDYIKLFDASKNSIKIAGEVKDFDPLKNTSAKDIKKSDRFIHLGLQAAIEAMSDSGIQKTDYDFDRIGVSSASGIGGLPSIQKNTVACESVSPKRVSPFFVPSSLVNMLGGIVSINLQLKGPNISSVTACAAGTHSAIECYKTIITGGADVMLSVGAESAICSSGVAGFANMKALSTIEDPQKSSRPFDKDRAGFVIGEGAGALILEEYEAAKKRGAKIYAEIIGYGESSDAHHITAPAPNGEGAFRAMRAALKMANISEIDYISAHGTSTKFNDWYESLAVKRLFKDKTPPMSSIKGNIGHCLGAAGSIEAAMVAKMFETNKIVPTINYETKDEDCDLDYVPNTPRDLKIETAMSNSFGFGGTNGVLIFKRV